MIPTICSAVPTTFLMFSEFSPNHRHVLFAPKHCALSTFFQKISGSLQIRHHTIITLIKYFSTEKHRTKFPGFFFGKHGPQIPSSILVNLVPKYITCDPRDDQWDDLLYIHVLNTFCILYFLLGSGKSLLFKH